MEGPFFFIDSPLSVLHEKMTVNVVWNFLCIWVLSAVVDPE